MFSSDNCLLLADLVDGLVVESGEFRLPLGEEVRGKVLLEPLVLSNVVNAGPLHRVGLQHVAEHGDHLLVQVVGNGEDASCSKITTFN
jgi:hypothetical protein